MNRKIRVGIIGGTAFTSKELIKILLNHPQVEMAWLTSTTQVGEKLSSVFPQWTKSLGDWEILKRLEEVKDLPVEVVFSCLPHAHSANSCANFVGKAKIIDLSADFRLKSPYTYLKYYGHEHPYSHLLSEAVFGLADYYPQQIQKANIVGNPGCYPTSILLPLLPFIEKGWVQFPVIADSKSGVSGAGRTPTSTTHYNNANEAVAPYKGGRSHRHVSEIDEQMQRLGGEAARIIFTPHLMPMDRGIESTLYIRTTEPVSQKSAEDLLDTHYGNSFFVKRVDHYPSTKDVTFTNRCHIKVESLPEENLLILYSVIDNLIKGASGQAVQNMNLMLGLPAETGFGI